MPRLTEKQKSDAVRRYARGDSSRSLALEFGVGTTTMLKLLKQSGVKMRGKRQLAVNEHFFDAIDSEVKAYWLGFLFAEGSLDHKRYCLGLKLGKHERTQVEKFRQTIQAQHEVKQTADGKDAWVIKIGSKILYESLVKFGFGKNKTLAIRMPILSKHLQHHFVRGYFDGDGWISHADKSSVCIGFCSCSKKMLNDVQSWLTEEIGKECGSLIVRKRDHIPNQHDSYRLHIGGRNTAKMIGEILYADATVFMKRKQKRFLKLK